MPCKGRLLCCSCSTRAFGWLIIGLRCPTNTANSVEEQVGSSPKGIHKNRRDRKRHGHHCPDGIDQSSRGQGNSYAIEEEGEDDILPGFAIAMPTDLAGSED